MDIGKVPLLETIRKRMGWLTERQSVVSQNIANVDTPGYTPRDLKEPNFGEMLSAQEGRKVHKVSLATTQADHMAVGGERGNVDREFRTELVRNESEATLDGNTVVLEDEMMKVAETASAYQLATGLYKKHVSMIKTALGRSG